MTDIKHLIFPLFFKKKKKFFDKERDRARVGKGQRERGTEFEAGSRLPAVSTEPDAGLELTNLETMT